MFTVNSPLDQEQEVPTDEPSFAEQAVEPADPSHADVPKRTHRRHKQSLREYLTDNVLVNLDLFGHYCKSKPSVIDIDTTAYSLMGNMNQRGVRHRGDPLNTFLQTLTPSCAEVVLIYWLDILLQNEVFEDQS